MRQLAGAVLALIVAAPLAAQDDPRAACADVPIDTGYCGVVALGAEALLPAMVLAAEGGSPIPGTASTLGMRLTSMPRWTLGGRLTVARATGPALVDREGEMTRVMPLAIAADASVGLLPGWNPLPTVGGVGSVDVLLSGAVVPLLGSDRYGGSGGWGFGAGVRIGLLRESFTLPGVSVSGMYRQLRDIKLGDDELGDTDSYVRSDLSVLSLRAAASKAILLLTLTGGVGYDRMSGDVEFGYDNLLGETHVTAEDARMDRVTIFGEASYTLMVLNFVIGGGWQEGPDDLGDDDGYKPEGAAFGSAALRLSI